MRDMNRPPAKADIGGDEPDRRDSCDTARLRSLVIDDELDRGH